MGYRNGRLPSRPEDFDFVRHLIEDEAIGDVHISVLTQARGIDERTVHLWRGTRQKSPVQRHRGTVPSGRLRIDEAECSRGKARHRDVMKYTGNLARQFGYQYSPEIFTRPNRFAIGSHANGRCRPRTERVSESAGGGEMSTRTYADQIEYSAAISNREHVRYRTPAKRPWHAIADTSWL